MPGAVGSPLILDDNPRSLRVVEQVLQALGVGARVLAEPGRLKIEIRSSEPTLFLVAAEAFDGRALDLVREFYGECRAPVPVVAWSGRASSDHLKNQVPIELKLVSALSSPIDPGEFARAVLDSGVVVDAGAAAQVLADLAADARDTAVRLDPPAGRYDLLQVPAARIFFGASAHQWTGRVSIDSPQGGRSFWFDRGDVVFAASAEGSDLLTTLTKTRKSRTGAPPPGPLKTLDEEVGWLLATRTVGFHEIAQVQLDTLARLVGEVNGLERGAVVGLVGEAAPARYEKGRPAAALVLQASRQAQASGQDRGLSSHGDATLVVRLPPRDRTSHWGLGPDDRRILDAVDKARGKDVSLDQLMRVIAPDPERRGDARALLSVLRDLGFLDFRGKPFDKETEELLDQFTRELHRVSRGSPFAVLGLEPTASDNDVREANRTLARKWHPDNFYDKHRRVQRAAEQLFARIQEAHDALKTTQLREAERVKWTGSERLKDEGRRDPVQAKVALAQGRLYLRNKKVEEARDSFRDATLLDPQSAEARTMLGWARYVCDPGASAAAVKDLEAAALLDPKAADAHHYLGRIALMQRDTARALKFFQKALAIKPDHTDALREVRLLEKRQADQEPGGAAALFGSLFNRKKPGPE